MPYWQLFYHLVWSTKNREPLITSEVESIIHGYLHSKAVGLDATVFALNGMPDHVHMVVAIPPKIAVARFIGQVKAVASTRFNKMDLPNMLYWQDEYAAFSFDGKRMSNYISYVERQKEHHVGQTTIPLLERTSGETTQLLRESSPDYAIDDLRWRAELDELMMS